MLKRREPKLHEDTKNAMVIKGTKANLETSELLMNLRMLRESVNYSRSHPMHPFDDVSGLVRLCNLKDLGLFAFGSSSKKRPCRLILGRIFNQNLLDMQELAISNFEPLRKFKSSSDVGSRPLLLFQGAFDSDALKRTKSLLMDFFGRAPVHREEQVLLKGIDTAVVCSAPEGEGDVVLFRRYRIEMSKDLKVPKVSLEECGPRFTMTLDRTKAPDPDTWKSAMRVPRQLAPKKEKNVSMKEGGQKRGRLHLGKQDFDQIHTVHHGLSKKPKTRGKAEDA